MGEVIVVNVDPRIGQHFSKVVGGAYEKVVCNHVRNHLLVQVAVSELLPVSVLEHNKFFYFI